MVGPHLRATSLRASYQVYDECLRALGGTQRRGNTPQSTKLAQPEDIIVWRYEVTPKVRRMSGEEAMMWSEAVNAVPFGALCELVAVYDDPDQAPLRAAQHLQGWIAAGLLTKTMLTE